jgi:hypothetical protein
MVVGAMAVAMWGEPRATLDVDLSVWVEADRLAEVVTAIVARFQSVADPLEFVVRTRVLPIAAADGTRADLVFAALDREREMLVRAVPKRVDGRSVPVASVEDLIYMKLISERAKDRDDATRLLLRFRKSIDRCYLRPKLEEISAALASADILQTYDRILAM